jgi:hypothetical protein
MLTEVHDQCYDTSQRYSQPVKSEKNAPVGLLCKWDDIIKTCMKE